MPVQSVSEQRQVEVYKYLDRVTDPELDEAVTDMGFIEGVDISDSGDVRIDFRMPTYWCSPCFVYMMGEDMRDEINKLPWVKSTTISVKDHMYVDRINDGVNSFDRFSTVFAEFSDEDDLDELREKFSRKAFQRRQETMLLALEEKGISDEQIVAMTLSEYDGINYASEDVQAGKARYREILTERKLAVGPQDRAFCKLDGKPLDAADLAEYLLELRSTRINMEFNGVLCRGLKNVRRGEKVVDGKDATLVDFMLDRVIPKESLETNG